MPIVRCRECGAGVSTEAPTCPRCGAPNPGAAAPPAAPPAALPSGNDPALLPQVQGWNWGAFGLTWIWAFAHNLPGWGAGFLAIDLFGFFIHGLWPLGFAGAIYLGLKGNELAWQQRPFRSPEEFRATEAVWRVWGIIAVVARVLFFVIALAAAVVLLRAWFSWIFHFMESGGFHG